MASSEDVALGLARAPDTYQGVDRPSHGRNALNRPSGAPEPESESPIRAVTMDLERRMDEMVGTWARIEARVKALEGPPHEEPGMGTSDPLLQFFDYFHLPPHLKAVSMTFWELAHNLVVQVPRNPERDMALRKLIEAKDCAVRAVLFKG